MQIPMETSMQIKNKMLNKEKKSIYFNKELRIQIYF